MFAGSGNESRSHGVAILSHKRWSKRVLEFQAISARIAALSIRKGKLRLQLVSAYFPHTGYTDRHIQHLYDTASALLREARSRRMRTIMGADFNAQ
eukprot:2350998-Pyramimonas_sp.AAC.1